MQSLPTGVAPSALAAVGQALPEARDGLLRELTTPIVEADLTTFIYSGTATRVEVRDFMAYFPPIAPLRLIAPELWAVTVRLPDRVRFEYKLAVDGGPHSDLVSDPYNPRKASGSLGTNSVVFGPGYVEPPWAAVGDRQPNIRRRTIPSSAFGDGRSVQWYVPPNAAKRLPLVVVHDGSDFMAHASMAAVLDYLMSAGEIPPAVVAFVDPENRFLEYVDNPRHVSFLEEVVDMGSREFGAHPDPSSRVYVGASLGAVAALAAAWHGPALGGLILYSGAFVTALGGPSGRGQRYLPVVEFMRRFRADPGNPAARIYQSCGKYEGLVPDNRFLSPVLRDTGADAVYEETPDGHHFHNWRDTMKAAFTHTLGGVATTMGAS